MTSIIGVALLNPPELGLRHPRGADTRYVVCVPVGTGVSFARVGAACRAITAKVG